MQPPFTDISALFKRVSPDNKIQKISVNGGFTCPNRDGSKGTGGCTYCNNTTFVPTYCDAEKSIEAQIKEGIKFFARKYPTMQYLAYFQSYSNSYADTTTAITRYKAALKVDGVKGLIISTRPDCISNTLLEELSQISRTHTVMIEFGAESCNNNALQQVNRCHTWKDVVDAVNRTVSYNIECGIHLIMGLPGDTKETLINSAKIVSQLPITTLKLHQLQIIKGTKLHKQYQENPKIVELYEVDEYIDMVAAFLERLNPTIYMDRFVSQSPPNLLIAPRWGLKNYEFTAKLIKAMSNNGQYQGRLYNNQ